MNYATCAPKHRHIVEVITTTLNWKDITYTKVSKAQEMSQWTGLYRPQGRAKKKRNNLVHPSASYKIGPECLKTLEFTVTHYITILILE